MTYRHRKTRKKVKKQRKIILISIITISLLLTVSYASFQTNINITTSGKTKIMYSHMKVKKLSKINNTTMFTDPFGNIRYTGPNEEVNNYVCLVDESPCQDKHLFRIIGSFLNIDDGNGNLETRVKVISAYRIGTEYWNIHGSNNWSSPATLNTYLNTTYYRSLNEKAQNLIGNSLWNLGGISSEEYTSRQVYQFERGNIGCYSSPEILTWTGKIALIYPSDYGYASKECYQEKKLYDSTNNDDYSANTCKDNNWLFISSYSYDWLISSNSNGNEVFIIGGNGSIRIHPIYAEGHALPVRPSFFLKSNTILITKNHDGTKINPYIVKLYEEN